LIQGIANLLGTEAAYISSCDPLTKKRERGVA
jgi:hypothetical protein